MVVSLIAKIPLSGQLCANSRFWGEIATPPGTPRLPANSSQGPHGVVQGPAPSALPGSLSGTQTLRLHPRPSSRRQNLHLNKLSGRSVCTRGASDPSWAPGRHPQQLQQSALGFFKPLVEKSLFFLSGTSEVEDHIVMFLPSTRSAY